MKSVFEKDSDLPNARSDLPRCHFCNHELGEGDKINYDGKTRYLCGECRTLIHAVAHDAVNIVFNEISEIMSRPGATWKEELQLYSFQYEKTAKSKKVLNKT